MLTRGRRQDKCGSVEKHGKISAFCNRNALKSLSSGTSFFYNWICNIKLLKETKSRKNVVLCSVNVAHICVKLRENLHFCRGQEGMGFIGNLKYKILHLDPLEKEIWYTPKAFGVCPYSMWQNVVVLLQEEFREEVLVWVLLCSYFLALHRNEYGEHSYFKEVGLWKRVSFTWGQNQ